MERFEKQKFNKKDHRKVEIAATICRILLTPIFVWDGTIFKSDKM